MDNDAVDALITRYRSGVDDLLDALSGITPDELDRRPAPGAWTPREIVHHVADSETNSYVRIRKLLAEDTTTIHGYDEMAWSQALHYTRPIEASLAVTAAVRASSLELFLTALAADPSILDRTGTHTESGRYTVAGWLASYAAHPHDHADQIRRARRGQV